MKQGRTLNELAQEITRQQQTKRDFVAPASKIHFAQDNDSGVKLQIEGGNFGDLGFKPTTEFHAQLASYLNIPLEYYKRMIAQTPELLVSSANKWLSLKTDETGKGDDKRMIRTLDGNARALLSSRYRALDNYDLAQAVLPILSQHEFKVESCEVTPSRMYLKVQTPKVSGEIVKGDTVNFGLSIRNSEIGQSSLAIDLLAYRLVCSNGLIAEKAIRKNHVGARQGANDGSWELFSTETKRLSDTAFWNQVKDIVQANVRDARQNFDGLLQKFRKTTEIALPKPQEAVEIVQEKFGLSEDEGYGVLEQLIRGGDSSLWGLTNAVTAFAQDNSLTYDRATELEAIGGKVIELTAKDLIYEAA